ncbi:hypothetical protein [Puia dinghuensis]|uniref:hypothetical protein n=1 Tax=Puia dinghuensis TaxID=1792502 RepID=UPI0016684481|nr:hypothetical protein [Puia dinghuensis]
MTEEQIEEQIRVLHEVGLEIRRSKKTARQFLIDAGIILPDKNKKKKAKKKK